MSVLETSLGLAATALVIAGLLAFRAAWRWTQDGAQLAADADVTPWGDFPQIPPGFPLAGGPTGRGVDGSGVAALSQDHVHNGGGNAS
jgi:hypothetical protein